MSRFPVTEPFDSGLLEVGDGNRMYYEQVGNPAGIPVAFVHGGPGSGCSVRQRGAFDPERYRVVLFDQRNCGRSLPHASDPATDLSANTTQHLVADMDLLREHLGLEQWMLYGGSWGSTLILAYAETHPERVTHVLIPAVTVTDSEGVAWLYEGVGRIFPEAQERFREYIPAADRGKDVFDLLAAYGKLMEHPDPEVRARTAHEWMAWEDAVISQEVNGSPARTASAWTTPGRFRAHLRALLLQRRVPRGRRALPQCRPARGHPGRSSCTAATTSAARGDRLEPRQGLARQRTRGRRGLRAHRQRRPSTRPIKDAMARLAAIDADRPG